MDEQAGLRPGRLARRGRWLLALGSVLVTVCALEVAARLATLAVYGRATQGQVGLRYFPYVESVETLPPPPEQAASGPAPGFAELVGVPPRPGDGRLRAVVIGASTARGLPDRMLAAKLGELYRREVEVVNLAVPSHVVNQEVIVLGLFGLNFQPDLVISIDGANDPVTASKTWQPGVAIPALSLAEAARSPLRYAVTSTAKRSQLVTLLLKWRARKTELDFQSRPDLVEATARQYLQGVRALSVMARGAGAAHVLVLQPYLHLRKNPTAVELDLGPAKRFAYRSRFMADYLAALAARLEALPLAAGVAFVDGTAAFDGSAETCFVDEVHLTDRGYELLVEKIVAAIRGAGLDRGGTAEAGLWPVAPAPGEPAAQVGFRN